MEPLWNDSGNVGLASWSSELVTFYYESWKQFGNLRLASLRIRIFVFYSSVLIRRVGQSGPALLEFMAGHSLLESLSKELGNLGRVGWSWKLLICKQSFHWRIWEIWALASWRSRERKAADSTSLKHTVLAVRVSACLVLFVSDARLKQCGPVPSLYLLEYAFQCLPTFPEQLGTTWSSTNPMTF